VAYAYLGILATSALEPGLSVDYRTKAYELRDRTSDSERYWVTAAYQKGVTGNISKAIEARSLDSGLSARVLPHVYLGGAVLPIVGQYERAVEDPPREFVCGLTIPSHTLSAFLRTPLLIASMRRRPPTRWLLNAKYILPSSISACITLPSRRTIRRGWPNKLQAGDPAEVG